MNRDRRKREIATVIGRITTGVIATFLPQSEAILSPNVVWLLCASAFAFAQGELEQKVKGERYLSWWTIGCFSLGVLVNIGTSFGDVLGGIIGWICMVTLYVLGIKCSKICR